VEAEYKFGITGYSSMSLKDCPAFTYMTRTKFGAKLVEKRMKEQGLHTSMYDLERETCPGLNPYYEEELSITPT